MGLEIRYARADELPALADVDGANFGFLYDAQALEDAPLDIDPERVLVTVDDSRIVGLSGEIPLAIALPGGSDAKVTGLSWVSVEVTHRRRGIVRAMIERQLRAAAERDDAAVVLMASEGGIYGRYGFGVATQLRRSRVQRRRARLAVPPDTSAVRRMATDEARAVLPALYERWRRATPGGVSRDERRWQLLLLDREYQRHGASGLFHLVHPEGYVSYRIKQNWNDGDPQHECVIVDYAPATDAAHTALWQTLLSMDLVGSYDSHRIPVDDPLPLLLEDARGIDTVHVADGLWLRPVGIAELLGRRRYGVEFEGVLEVRDPLLGDGRYLLRGGPDGSTCERTDQVPDIVLSVADLGALCLGGTRLVRLARTGRVDCADAALLRRLDLALLADRQPAHGTAF